MTTTPALDPDRFFDLRAPGSQEWWYFDAVSDDGRDAVVAIFFVGLPFDPRYGVAALRHLKRPSRRPAPDPLNHCGLSLCWYRRDGATVRRRGPGNAGIYAEAYALNVYGCDRFAIGADPFRLAIAGGRVERDADGYRIVAETPDTDRRRTIRADLRFRPAARTEPIELDLGGIGSPHHWIMAAPDCRVDGTIGLDGPGSPSLEFRGRGYHDHNAGLEELSQAMKRWEWGRVHASERTEVYYIARPTHGPGRSLWISCLDGRPERVSDKLEIESRQPWKTGHGIPFDGALVLRDGDGRTLERWPAQPVDSGPFYQRWITEFRTPEARRNVVGLSELLDTKRLNQPLSNWMIPFRLRRPDR